MNNEQILVKFLNCGFLDLKVLEDTKFDIMEIISEIERPTLNDIICTIFQKGIDLLLSALMEKQRDFDCPDERETHRHSRWFFLCGPRAYLTSGASTRLRPVHLHPTSCYP